MRRPYTAQNNTTVIIIHDRGDASSFGAGDENQSTRQLERRMPTVNTIPYPSAQRHAEVCHGLAEVVEVWETMKHSDMEDASDDADRFQNTCSWIPYVSGLR